MDTLEQIAAFRTKIKAFVSFPDQDWDLITEHLQFKSLRQHDFLIREGKQAYEIGFIVSGTLRQFYTRDGEEKTTYFYFENNFTGGYLSCITRQPSALSIQALADTAYISVPYQVLERLYANNFYWQEFGRKIAEYISIGLEERMAGLLILSPEERYLALLNSNKVKILERIPLQYIANYLGITPVSLSRIRKKIQSSVIKP